MSQGDIPSGQSMPLKQAIMALRTIFGCHIHGFVLEQQHFSLFPKLAQQFSASFGC